jgi:hypothetical protein
MLSEKPYKAAILCKYLAKPLEQLYYGSAEGMFAISQ